MTLTRTFLVVLLSAATLTGCVRRTDPPPAPAPAALAASDAVRIARIVRLMELNRRRVELEVERAGLSQRLGVNHPQMVALTKQMDVIDQALTAEFLPEERAAVSEYEDRAMELRMRLQELFARGRGENHPEVIAVRRQLAAVETMASASKGPEAEDALRARVMAEPDAPAPLIELALLYLQEGRTDEARRALARAQRLLRRR